MNDSSDKSLHFDLDHFSAVPLYLQFKEQLLNHIRKNRLRPGERLPDIRSLAAMAKTSMKTVGSGLDELLRERVLLRRPKHGTFVAGEDAPAVVPAAKKKRVCLVYHSMSLQVICYDQTRQDILAGVQKGCRHLDIDLVYLTGDLIANLDFYNSQDRLDIVGVVFIDGLLVNDRIIKSSPHLFPNLRFFFFNDYTDAFDTSPRNFYGVFHDDFSGGFDVGNLLVDRGYRRMAMVASKLRVNTNYLRRRAGFRLALTEAGGARECTLVELEAPQADTHRWDLKELTDFGVQAGNELLKSHPDVDAVFAVNDLIAAGILQAFLKAGRRDIALFGYDNVMPEVSRDRHFSTVDINFFQMGLRGIELMAASTYIPKAVFLPPRLICRLPPLTMDEQ